MSQELEPRPQMVALLRELEEVGAITPTSLSLASRSDLAPEQFTSIGVFLDYLHDGSKWWIADWAVEGEMRFGQDFPQIAGALRRSERTLLNWMWVAQRVPRSRRREGLSFTHHTLVAPFGPAEQEAWLDLAESQGWSSRMLKHEIDASGEGEMKPEMSTCPFCGSRITPGTVVRDQICEKHGRTAVEKETAGLRYLQCGCFVAIEEAW